MMNQRMGRAAQDAFKHMCSLANLTCNPSLEDDYGWDFLVEIPLAPTPDSPADKWPAAISAFVQVKSTSGVRRWTEMKVSNAIQLAKKPEPCFLVLFHRQDECERIYARLFDRQDMERALRRARETSIHGQPAHKAKVTFRFSDGEEHTNDLADWLVTRVRGLGAGYGVEKSQLAESVGYENKNWKAKFTFVGTRGWDDFVDLQLGLKDHLKVSKFTLFDERFGIETPNPVIENSEGGVFRLRPEKEIECVVSLETEDDVVTTPSKARIAAVPGSSCKDIKLAFLNELFVLVVARDKISLTMGDAWSNELSLLELEQLATLLSWQDQELRVRVTGDVPEIDIGVKLGKNLSRLDRGVVAAIGTLRCVASRSNANDIRLSMADVLSSYPELSLYHGILTEAQVAFGSTDPTELPCAHETLHNVIGMVDVEVGAYTFLTLFDAGIKTSIDEQGNLTIDLGRRNVRDCLVDKGREVVRARGHAVHDECAGGYGDDWLAIGSLNELIEMSTAERNQTKGRSKTLPPRP